MRDSGAASIWVLSFATLVLLIGIIGGLRGLAVLARHRAEGAADLAALAAAHRIGVGDDECAAAAWVARANGASVRACTASRAPDGRSGQVRVVVEVAVALPGLASTSVTASAVAARDPPR